MSAVTFFNLGAYAGAIILAVMGTLLYSPPLPPAMITLHAVTSPVDVVSMPDGTRAVRDARGTMVPVRSWQRIVTLDLLADELASLLVPHSHLVAVSAWAQGPEAWRVADLPRTSGLNDLESLLGLRPDLILISTFGGESDRIQRLRDHGVSVFDLGPAGGRQALCANLRRVATVLNVAERGERLAANLERRMAHVATHLPAHRPRRRALVLTPTADQVYGGTTGSSFHDMVVSAGLSDALEGRFDNPWPRISAELALHLDPDLIVTRSGSTEQLRRIPGFDRLRALTTPGGVIELPLTLFDSPGLSMLEAAEALCDAAYPISPKQLK